MITGIIQDKTESTGGEGAKSWRRYAFKIDDKTYSTFSETIGEKFKKGDNVTITGVQEGQYWNMKTMDYAQGEAEVPIVKVGSNNPSTDNKITRMACLKAAVRFFRGAEGIGKENIIELASDFERWVNRDGD